MTLLADLVATSGAIAGTSSRTKKVETLADLLRRLEPDEIPIAVAFLSGAPRQGRIGIGYRTIYGIEARGADDPSLTIDEVDAAIDEVQGATGGGSATRRRATLEGMFGRATEPEIGFLRRLFTGELRQGALVGLMTDAIARASEVPLAIVRRALMLSGDLPQTAALALSEGEDALRGIGLEIFRPVLPMLASTSADVAEAVESFDNASVEWKLDGIRIQIHRRGDDVKIYTRNLNDITEALPGIVEVSRRLPVQQVVLDGEALWMDFDMPGSFQDTVSRIDSDAPPEGVVTFLFDILHVDGEDLLDLPLQDRAARLDAVAPELRIPATVTSDPSAAERVLEGALDAGHEGVVIKDVTSTYAAGRRGKAWRKVKPVRTYDLVVIGAEWGHGRRQGWLSNLHLAARDPATGAFIMVGKCFKGLTDELLRWQTQALLEREIGRKGIAVSVRPELVVEIALDGVQRSTRYPGGVALRFARVKRYRDDKGAAEADTIQDLQALLPARDDVGRG